MPFATIPCLALIQVLYAKTSESFQLTRLNDQNTWLLGAALGLAYALFELPNSFVKRKVGIPEGQQARGFWQPIFFMFDHFDSLSGITLVYFLFLKIQPSLILALLFTAPVIHTVVNLVLFALKFRKNPL